MQLDARLATLQNQMALTDSLDKEVEVSAPALRQNHGLLELNKRIQDTESQLTQMQPRCTGNRFPIFAIADAAALTILKKQRDDLQKKQDEELAKPQEPAKKITNFQRSRSGDQPRGSDQPDQSAR